MAYGLGADHWRQDEPKGLRDAALAWAADGIRCLPEDWLSRRTVYLGPVGLVHHGSIVMKTAVGSGQSL